MSKVERVCSKPGCTNVSQSQCSGCGEEFYCSKECQKQHWPEHKAKCKKVQLSGITSFESLTVKQLKTVFTNKTADMDNKRRDKLLKKMEKMVEKSELVNFVEQHVKFSEVEKLLTTPVAKPEDKQRAAMENAAKNYKGKSIRFDGTANNAAIPSAEQMRQQAAMMRSNPNLVRQANAAFANYTDEQIRQIADQLEQTASSPDTMKEVERMFQMSNEDRTVLQKVQEGLTGARKIDSAWIDDIVATLKSKPEVFKTLFKSGANRAGADGTVSPDQIETFIDMASKLDTWLLTLIAHAIWYLSSLVKPAMELYKTIDGYTFGSAKYLFLAIFAFVSYYLSVGAFYVLRIIFAKLYVLGTWIFVSINGPGAAQIPVGRAAQKASGAVAEEAVKAAAAAVGAGAAEFEF